MKASERARRFRERDKEDQGWFPEHWFLVDGGVWLGMGTGAGLGYLIHLASGIDPHWLWAVGGGFVGAAIGTWLLIRASR